MTPHQLRTFLAVADAGSVSIAAEHLVVSQSAVSASLAGLQRELGVRLLQRHGRGVRLTEEGAIYAGYARRILGLLAEALLAARDGHRPERGHVRLAAVPTAAEQVVPAYLATFRERYPDAQVGVDVGSRDDVFRRLLAHEVDLVIAGRPPDFSPLVSRAVADNELVLVAAPRLVAAVSAVDRDAVTRDAVTLDPVALDPVALDAVDRAIGKLPWLLREIGSGTRETTLGYLAEHELTPDQLTLGANGAVIAGAIAGLGVTLVSLAAVSREIETGQLAIVPASGAPLHRPWHVVTRAELPGPTQLFLDHVLGTQPLGSVPHFTAPRRRAPLE